MTETVWRMDGRVLWDDWTPMEYKRWCLKAAKLQGQLDQMFNVRKWNQQKTTCYRSILMWTLVKEEKKQHGEIEKSLEDIRTKSTTTYEDTGHDPNHVLSCHMDEYYSVAKGDHQNSKMNASACACPRCISRWLTKCIKIMRIMWGFIHVRVLADIQSNSTLDGCKGCVKLRRSMRNQMNKPQIL